MSTEDCPVNRVEFAFTNDARFEPIGNAGSAATLSPLVTSLVPDFHDRFVLRRIQPLVSDAPKVAVLREGR
jgi:hypothetical protein